MNKPYVVQVLLFFLVAVSLARDLPLPADDDLMVQPEDYFYDNPFIPPWFKQIAQPWIPNLGPGFGLFPPMTPPPPSSDAGSECGPLVPPALCSFITPPSSGDSNCGPLIPPAFCSFLSPFIPQPPAPPSQKTPPAPPAHNTPPAPAHQ